MTFTAAELAKAQEIVDAMPPFTERQRDELALLLRPWVLETQARPRLPRRAPGGGQATT